MSRMNTLSRGLRSNRTRCHPPRLCLEFLEPRRLMAICGPALPGDANLDQVFDESDLVVVFQAGKYETGQPAAFREGDWDGDGFFSSSDLVDALQTGRYRLPPEVCDPVQEFSAFLKPQAIFDPLIGQIASVVMIPDGWSMQGVVQYGSVPALTLTASFQTISPDGMRGVETLVSDPGRTWSEGGFPPPEGQLDFRGLVLERPKDGFTHFETYLFPILQQRHPDYQVLQMQREPLLIDALHRKDEVLRPFVVAAGGSIAYDAISVHARYVVNGTLVDELIHAQFQYISNQVGFLRGTDWGLISLERVFAPTQALESELSVLKMIGRSAIPNYSWFVAIQNHRATLLGIVADAQQAWNSYIQQQNALIDARLHIYDQFDYYIRGTRVAANPFTGQPQEISDQAFVWFGSDGTIQLHSDPNFDPNQFGGTWLQALR